MTRRPLTGAEIDALIGGSVVSGAPPELGVVVASLRAHAEASPAVPPTKELAGFFAGCEPLVGSSASGGAEVVPIGRRRWSSIARVASAAGLVPAHLLVGATMAAAAVAGAHAAGVVDVPLLPDRAPLPELVGAFEPEPPTHTSTPPTTPGSPGVGAPAASHGPESESPSGRPVQVSTTAPGPRPSSADGAAAPDRSPPTLPDEAAVAGEPGCDLGLAVALDPPASVPSSVPPDVTGSGGGPGFDPCGAEPHADESRRPSEPGPGVRGSVPSAPIGDVPPGAPPHAPPSVTTSLPPAPENLPSPRTP